MTNSPDDDGTDLSGQTLVLFFTFGVSLADWEADGLIDRELALYNELADAFDQVHLFTYGDETDLAYDDRLADNVSVVPKRGISSDVLYSLLCPFLQRRTLAEADVVKTNQMLGAWTAVLASLIFRVPMVVRTGYVLSTFYRELDKPLAIRAVAVLVEFVAYKAAAGIITSSPHGFDYVEDRYSPRGRHMMVPNYIETDVFRPMDVEPVGDLCFVGRLAEQKNLLALLEALKDLPYALTLVGEGPLRTKLEDRAVDLGVDTTFAGQIPNHEVPPLLHSHMIFVLPSHFEGMPKSLLEAMACGLAVLGAEIQGIEDVVTHGVDGYLCPPDHRSLGSAIQALMNDGRLRQRLGNAARETIETGYSLEGVVEQEATLYSRITGGSKL